VLRGLPEVRLMTPEKLALALDWRDTIESWFGAVDQHVQEILESGGEVPGYKLVEGRSTRQWPEGDGGAGAVDFLESQGYKRELLVTKPEPLSPAKMEKVVGKKAWALLPPGSWVKPPGRLKVAKAGDPRAVAPSRAKEMFDPLGPVGMLPAPAALPAPEPVDPFAVVEHTAVQTKDQLWPA